MGWRRRGSCAWLYGASGVAGLQVQGFRAAESMTLISVACAAEESKLTLGTKLEARCLTEACTSVDPTLAQRHLHNIRDAATQVRKDAVGVEVGYRPDLRIVSS